MYLEAGSTGRLVTFSPEGEENLLHARKVGAAGDGGANSFRFCIGLFEIMVASRRGESRRTLSALSCLRTWDDIVFQLRWVRYAREFSSEIRSEIRSHAVPLAIPS